MKKLVTGVLACLLLLVFGLSWVLAEDTWVNGYTRRDGTYVPGYHRSSPDGNPFNNYSTKGNVNPYTGERGYVDPSRTPNSWDRPTYSEPGSGRSKSRYGY